MLCTECKKEQEKRIPNEEKENAQPAEKVCSDVHTTLKSKRSAALILVTGATLMLILSIKLDTLTARILKLSSDSHSRIESAPLYSRRYPADR